MRKRPSTIGSIHRSTAYRNAAPGPCSLIYAWGIRPSKTTSTGQRLSTPIRNRVRGEIMIANPFGGMTSPSLPTLSDIQHRIAELESVQQQLDTQAQLPIRSAPRTPPPPSAPPNPILSEAALYGVAGSAVRTLAPAHRGPSRRHSPPVAGRVRQCRWSRAPLHGRCYPPWSQPFRGAGR